MPGKFVVKKGPTGKFRFSLVSTNGQVVASSQTYETKRAAMGGVASVQKLAAGATIVDTTVAAPARAGPEACCEEACCEEACGEACREEAGREEAGRERKRVRGEAESLSRPEPGDRLKPVGRTSSASRPYSSVRMKSRVAATPSI